ncbi:hypothetical protein [Spiroplasma endosymbiont of Labia minor]|uniref:hypothetical protein n=1 Tax=Spiroplasma endosymbiont of Labia minor TaxID=3066305 RepID=UPI0030CE56C5
MKKNNENIVSENTNTDELLIIKHNEQRKKITKYFKITTPRVTFIGLILGINIIFAFIGKYIMGMIPFPMGGGFLVIELTFFTYLVSNYILNLFYTIILLTAATWLRLGLVGDEPIGLLALYLGDLGGLLIFALLVFIIKIFFYVKKQNKLNEIKWQYIIFTIAGIFSILLISGLEVLFNWSFMLRLYGINGKAADIFLIPIFAFNITKYTINFVIFLSILYVLNSLKTKFNF